MTTVTPIANSWWVLPRQFLAGPFAGTPEEAGTVERLSALLAEGLCTFVVLQDLAERDPLGRPFRDYVPDLHRQARALGVQTNSTAANALNAPSGGVTAASASITNGCAAGTVSASSSAANAVSAANGGVTAQTATLNSSAAAALSVPNGSISVGGTASSIAQPAWTAPTLSNGWANYGNGWAVAGYMKDAMGFIHLRGYLKAGTTVAAGTALFTLPSGYRPAYAYTFSACHINGTTMTHMQIRVASTGVVSIDIAATASTGVVTLDGITFNTAS